jgi:hypothetical protein
MLPVSLTMREVIKWIRRKLVAAAGSSHDSGRSTSPGAAWVRAGLAILAPSLRFPAQQDAMARVLCSVLDPSGAAAVAPAAIRLVQRPRCVELVDKTDRALVQFPGAQLERVPTLRGRDVTKLPQKFLLLLLRVAEAMATHEPVLLVGPTSCKSMVIRLYCELTAAAFGRGGAAAAAVPPGEDLVEVHLTTETESQDLIGGIRPVSPRDAALRCVVVCVCVWGGGGGVWWVHGVGDVFR